MKILALVSDTGACYDYRIRIPFEELKRFKCEYTYSVELPNNPWGDTFSEIGRFFEPYDIIVFQRSVRYETFKVIKDVCNYLGKKLIYEVDDNYLNIPDHNPASKEINVPGFLDNYKQMMGLFDLVTVTTQELKDVLYPFNKNIHVLPNNIQSTFAGVGRPGRTHNAEQVVEGKVRISPNYGFPSIPDYWIDKSGNKNRTIRIGYSGTPTHHEDFKTIQYSLEKVVKKHEGKVWLVLIGDPWFHTQLTKCTHRIVHIPYTWYSSYQMQLRNIDIGLAPLEPTIFNMSKSPIKAIEYAAWGTPSILPNYITYNREFTDGKNCLFYNNSKEFEQYLENLIVDHDYREQLGEAAMKHVQDNRLEKLHAKTRYDLYKSLLDSTKPLKIFTPQKESLCLV